MVFFSGYEKIAEILIENGADVNATNSNGYTALTFAARNGNVEIIKLINKTV